MRAKEFGTEPKRPSRPGSRPERGHEAQPRYKTDEGVIDVPALSKRIVQMRQTGLNDQQIKAQLTKEGIPLRYIDQAFAGAELTELNVEETPLVNSLQWPEVVNKVNSAMKATGWKGGRKGDDAYIFSSKGQETDDQWYFVIIDNAGEGFFTYALGTVEDGDPYIDDAYKGTLPNTEASVSELINMIRDGFGLNESMKQKKETPKPRNFVAKNAINTGAGAHKDKKKAQKQGDVKHKNKALELAEMEAILDEWKATRKLCKSSTPDKDLGASALASCKSQGLRARDGNKSHLMGKGPESRMVMGGHRVKGKKYGGKIPDWGTRK